MKISYFKIKQRNFSYFYRIMEENIRFFEIVEELKSRGVLSNYIQLAEVLDTNKAGVSDLKNGRKKLSIDNIRRMKLSYPFINVEYIIMGSGNMMTEEEDENKSFIDDSSNIYLIEKVAKQAEEIGMLKQQIEQLKEKNTDAAGAICANVG